MAIIVVSSELPEIDGLSDRILVMREGPVMANLSRSEATEEQSCTTLRDTQRNLIGVTQFEP